MVVFRYFISDKTLILCNSGAISPKMEFSITSHINELVKAYGERVNLLEEKVYKYMVTQNRMQLANAGYSCYYTFYKNKTSITGFFGYSSMSNNHFQIANEGSNS